MSLLRPGSLHSLVNKAGGSRVASRLAVCRPPCAPQHAVRRNTAAAAAAPSADAAPAAEEPAAAEQPKQQRKAPTGGRRRGDSNNNRGDAAASDSSDAVQLVRIAAETIHTKVAAYLLRTFADHDSSYTVILQAAGAAAYAQALKSLARLQQMLSDDPNTADHIVVFKPRRVQATSERRDGEGMRTFSTMRIVVNLAPKSDWPAAALAPNTREDAEGKDADAGKSGSSSGSSSKESRLFATAIRWPENPEENKREKQRLVNHMLRSSQRSLPAQFLLAGRKDKLASVAALLLYAADEARLSALTAGDEPHDLTCTIVAQSKTVERFPASADAGEASSDAAAAEGADDAAAEGTDDPAEGASADAELDNDLIISAETSREMFMRNLYFVTMQRSAASRNALSSARAAMRAQQRVPEAPGSSSRGGGRGSSPTQTRPGYIEVREEDWNQLKEQLQVVPHLTEQLQIMTRQHEQLLSLLAAQQGAAAQQPSDSSA